MAFPNCTRHERMHEEAKRTWISAGQSPLADLPQRHISRCDVWEDRSGIDQAAAPDRSTAPREATHIVSRLWPRVRVALPSSQRSLAIVPGAA